jgi:hypothetical protein
VISIRDLNEALAIDQPARQTIVAKFTAGTRFGICASSIKMAA